MFETESCIPAHGRNERENTTLCRRQIVSSSVVWQSCCNSTQSAPHKREGGERGIAWVCWRVFLIIWDGGLHSVMSNYLTLTATACWASLRERLAGWMEGESTGWLTCWLKKCGPYNTNGVNKALWEGESLTSVDIRPQLGAEGWFYFLVWRRVDLWVTDRRSTATSPVLCLATLLTAPEGPPPVREGWCRALYEFQVFWTFNSNSFVAGDYCFPCFFSYFSWDVKSLFWGFIFRFPLNYILCCVSFAYQWGPNGDM